MSKGKGKGSGFERDICRLLSLWWSDNERDDLFWRSSNSGGRATVRSRKGKSTFGQYGDVAATDPIGLDLLEVFTIELKRGYNKDNFMTMLDKPENAALQMWERFFRQVAHDSRKAKSKSWMLIWKKDRKDAIIYAPTLIIRQIVATGARLDLVPHLKGKIALKSKAKVNIFCCTLSDFLKTINPNHIRNL